MRHSNERGHSNDLTLGAIVRMIREVNRFLTLLYYSGNIPYAFALFSARSYPLQSVRSAAIPSLPVANEPSAVSFSLDTDHHHVPRSFGVIVGRASAS